MVQFLFSERELKESVHVLLVYMFMSLCASSLQTKSS